MAARTANAPRNAPPSRPQARPPSRPAPQPKLDVRLRILDGPGAGMEYALAGPVVRLGRGDENDIVLQDGNASRVHAEVVRDNAGRFLVRDLGSRNGIFVNRKKVPSASLKGGDRILIGSTSIEFVAAGGVPRAASTGGGSSSGRLAMIAGAAAVVAIGFVAILASHGGGGPGNKPTGTSDAKDLLQHDPNQVDISNLLGQKPQPGVQVSRNDSTKPSNSLPVLAPATNNTIAGLVSDGDQAYASQRLVDARADYFRAAQLDPNDKAVAAKLKRVENEILSQIDHHFRAGNTYTDTGRYDDAKREYEAVLLLDPDPNSENYTNAQVRIKEVDQKLQAQQSGQH